MLYFLFWAFIDFGVFGVPSLRAVSYTHLFFSSLETVMKCLAERHLSWIYLPLSDFSPPFKSNKSPPHIIWCAFISLNTQRTRNFHPIFLAYPQNCSSECVACDTHRFSMTRPGVSENVRKRSTPVSYTHLDVYKRQALQWAYPYIVYIVAHFTIHNSKAKNQSIMILLTKIK